MSLFPEGSLFGLPPQPRTSPGTSPQTPHRARRRRRWRNSRSEELGNPAAQEPPVWNPPGLRMFAASESPSRPIETFVFMDLEATGLPPSRPKIAEMCLFAVSRHALENPQYSLSHPTPIPLFPRLVDKLCVCLNPDKPFTPMASSITGLTNEMFSWDKKQSFNVHVLHMMTAFFSRQHPPICLVAHNGCGYDFPLLKAELSALGLPGLDGIYCADTLKAMKALDKEKNELHQLLYEPRQYGQKIKYGLRDLYFRFYKVYPLNSHSAEGDVLTLIRIFQQNARDLMCWMDSNARPFNATRAMYEENERYSAFSQTPEKNQQVYPSWSQIRARQQGAQRYSFSHDGTEPGAPTCSPLHQRTSDVPVEIKNWLFLFLGLIIVTWAALRNPV